MIVSTLFLPKAAGHRLAAPFGHANFPGSHNRGDYQQQRKNTNTKGTGAGRGTRHGNKAGGKHQARSASGHVQFMLQERSLPYRMEDRQISPTAKGK